MGVNHLHRGETESAGSPNCPGCTAVSRERGTGPSPAEVERILEKRAEMLALEEIERESGTEELLLVEFLLAEERYGLDSLLVQEVLPLRDVTEIPHTPPFVAGIINVRGRIVSVIDIKTFFNLPGRGITDRNKVIVLFDGSRSLGMTADAIVGVRRLARNSALTPPLSLDGVGGDCITGLLEDGLIVLDAGKILTDQRLIVDIGREK